MSIALVLRHSRDGREHQFQPSRSEDFSQPTCYNKSIESDPKTPVESMKENLTKASQTSSLLLSDIKECYRQASPTEEIVVREILKQAVELERRLNELAGAVNAER